MFVICLVIPHKGTTNYNKSSTQKKQDTPMKADECGYVFSYFFEPRSPIWQKHCPDVHFIRNSLCMIRNSVCIEVIVTSEESTHFDGLNNPGYLVFKESVNSQWKNRFQRLCSTPFNKGFLVQLHFVNRFRKVGGLPKITTTITEQKIRTRKKTLTV